MSDIIKKKLEEFDKRFTETATNGEVLVADYRNGKLILAGEIKDFISKALKEVREQTIEEEDNRIIDNINKTIEFYKDPKNQWDGLLNSNTRINTLDSVIEQIKPRLNCSN